MRLELSKKMIRKSAKRKKRDYSNSKLCDLLVRAIQKTQLLEYKHNEFDINSIEIDLTPAKTASKTVDNTMEIIF